ncbi:Wadjet anti-phage system protein JetD domain-containing protein [uncultured Sphaerochaeta sp.]|uniref:Wadjet anti-phage system protein JetD domain-containing protein n=1 Tax=uncultured Sphaerochaeta sp. TaxID=886478 RepID=UPI002A0A530C|nr:Wadjet anti-phage system protein JetD domain-containing protein [uncultured Sphaerochaeta sp.]
MKRIGPTPSEIREKLLEKWNKGFFLKNHTQVFPYSVSLGTIPSKQITEAFNEVREWIKLYQENNQVAQFTQWIEINHQYYGKSNIPKSLVFTTTLELAEYLHKDNEYKIFMQDLCILAQYHKNLRIWGERHPLNLLLIHADLHRLLYLLTWMIKNPRPNIYLRQIDLPEIDTKFTETHKKTLTAWLDATLPEQHIHFESSRFEHRFGYKSKPELIRFRILDSDLNWNGCDDISIPAYEFCNLYNDVETIPVQHVFVVENDICALSFPIASKSIVIFGRGYHFDHIRECEWLHRVKLHYWGDIDTHGFSILNEFRTLFKHTTSFLMDRFTLFTHKTSWGNEPKQTTLDLPSLTNDELMLFNELRYNTICSNLRLEQEFIHFHLVEKTVSNICRSTF